MVIDNFTLQDVGDALTYGLGSEGRAEITSRNTKAGYVVQSVPAAGIQVETLLQLLNTIVLQNELIVDAASIDTWKDSEAFLDPLRAAAVLVPKSFSEVREQWLPRREFAEHLLCFTPQLARDFGRYKAAFPKVQRNAAMSTLVWGTAGMLARSQYLDAPYLGHPSRMRLLEQTSFSPILPIASAIVTNFIVTERVKFFERATAGTLGRFACLEVPPLALEVVAESRDAQQLIPVALQLREKYRRLREWIGEYQEALQEGPGAAAKHKGVLEAAARDIEASFKPSWWSDLSISIGFSSMFSASWLRRVYCFVTTINPLL